MNKGNKETIRLDDALKEVFAKQAEQTPQLPADFSQRVAEAMMARRRKARLRTIVVWSTLGAVAATLLLAFFLLRKPASPVDKQIAITPTTVPSTPTSSDTTVFEPLYKQTAQFQVPLNSSFKERIAENLFINGYPKISPPKGFPHRGGTGGGSRGVLDYSKLAPGVYVEIDEDGDTVYVVISSQNVPTPPKSVRPDVNIAERMKQAEEFGKLLRQEIDSIHLALNR
ncbi:MAG: hypothetical protein J5720_05785 [Bacteroidaceae bacterium]|nr:hypothetical protein [Bacteroidaceae bacterium]